MQGTHAQPNVMPNAPHENAEDKFHLFTNIHGAEGGLVVPQKVYVVPGTDVTQNSIIKFWQYGRRGVCMEGAIKPSFIRGDEASTGMSNGNDPAEISSGSNKITIRINWPGCQSFSKDINIETTKNDETKKISVAKLLNSVAKALKRFCDGGKDGGYLRARDWNENGNSAWSLDGRISFDQLILHELHHVSRSSYQPVLLVKTGNVVPNDIGMESYASSSLNSEFSEGAAVEEGGDGVF